MLIALVKIANKSRHTDALYAASLCKGHRCALRYIRVGTIIGRFMFQARWLSLALIIVFVAPSEAAWNIRQDVDEMTEEKEFFATSDAVSPLNPMSPPYRDVKAWLGVGCKNDKLWAYIGFSKSPNLIDKKNRNGYSEIDARVKWNDSLEDLRFTQDWGSRFLHFAMDDLAVKKLKAYNNFMVELNWHGNGGAIFKFDLDGSSAAIGKIVEKCGIRLTKIGFEDKFEEAQSKKSFSSTYQISVSDTIVEVKTEGNSWKPFARDSSATDRIKTAISLIDEVAKQFDESYSLSIEVIGSTSSDKRSSDGARPFRGYKLKNILEEAVNLSGINKDRIKEITVNDRDPELYGNDAPNILIGRVKNTNEMVRFNIIFSE